MRLGKTMAALAAALWAAVGHCAERPASTAVAPAAAPPTSTPESSPVSSPAVPTAASPAATAKAGTAATGAASASEWQTSVTLYGWFAGLNGTTKLGRLPTTSVSVPFSDIASALDFAGMALVETRRGKWGFVGDLDYVKLSNRQSGPFDTRTAKMEVQQTIALAAGSYRLQEGEWGNLDVLAGARLFSIDTSFRVSSDGTRPTRKASENATWVDATMGLKSRLNINDRWFATVWGLAGAGGSKYNWDLLAAMSYQINKTWAVSAGYRAISVYYTSSSFDYKMIQYGPVLGLTARF
jgi:hypothetical protein